MDIDGQQNKRKRDKYTNRKLYYGKLTGGYI